MHQCTYRCPEPKYLVVIAIVIDMDIDVTQGRIGGDGEKVIYEI
jgi:hypothetical protein